MLLWHSFLYFLGRSIPGVITLVALGIYSRLLPPASYGQYAIVIAWTAFAGSVLFSPLVQGVNRFFSTYEAEETRFLSTLLVSFLGFTLATGLIAVPLMIYLSPSLRVLFLLGIVLLWARTWYELNATLAVIRLTPVRYGLLNLLKAVCALLLGVLLIQLGWGEYGLLLGVIAGWFFPTLIISGRQWLQIRPRHFDGAMAKTMIVYGVPLIFSAALDFELSTFDRILLGWMKGAATAGVYAAGYDLVQQMLAMCTVVVSLASFPRAVRAMESGEDQTLTRQLTRNITVLLAVAVPLTVIIAVLAGNIATVLLGASFRHQAAMIMPWLVVGILFCDIRAFYLDHSFQLAKKTAFLVWIFLAASLVNLGLNVWWIPLYGMMGAAYATTAAYILAFLMSWALGRRVLPMPLLTRDTGKILLANLLLLAALLPFRGLRGFGFLVMQMTWAVVVYCLLIWLFNVENVRHRLRTFAHARFLAGRNSVQAGSVK